ncbi:MAG: hypothetical protein ACHP84_00490 [Caulobacterales bacterium]
MLDVRGAVSSFHASHSSGGGGIGTLTRLPAARSFTAQLNCASMRRVPDREGRFIWEISVNIRHVLNPFLLAAFAVCAAAAAEARVTKITIDPATVAPKDGVACPLQQIFIGHITSNSGGDIALQWTTSDGQQSPVMHAPFDAAATKPVSYLWLATLKGPRVDGWVRLETKAPNRVRATARVASFCNPKVPPTTQ